MVPVLLQYELVRVAEGLLRASKLPEVDEALKLGVAVYAMIAVSRIDAIQSLKMLV